MQTTIRFFVSCFLCVSLLMVSGCGGSDNATTSTGSASSGGVSQDSSALVGTWIEERGAVYEFRQNGTGTIKHDGRSVAFTWKAENACLHMHIEPPPGERLPTISGEGQVVWDYEISGKTLTMSEEFSDTMTLTKQ